MSRAIPDLTQGFTGVSFPKTGPRQFGTDADGRTSVITFLNQVTEAIESMHDNQTSVRPDYLPINGMWCYTAPDGTKTVYQYTGENDVVLWSVTPAGITSIASGISSATLAAAAAQAAADSALAGLSGKLDASTFNAIPFPFKNVWISGQFTPSLAALINANHNLNIPNTSKVLADVRIVCAVSEAGYVAGDSASWGMRMSSSNQSTLGVPTVGANNIQVRLGNGGNCGLWLTRKDTGGYIDPTPANWRVVFRIFY